VAGHWRAAFLLETKCPVSSAGDVRSRSVGEIAPGRGRLSMAVQFVHQHFAGLADVSAPPEPAVPESAPLQPAPPVPMERPRRDPPDPPLSDEAVLLRLPRDDDAPVIATACADPEIARWVPVPVPYKLADAEAFLELVVDGWADGAHATFVIEDRATGLLAGMLSLDPAAAPGRASVGYWLAAGARGRGFATRAVRLLAGWAFADPRLERLELMTLVGNDASGRVALRAGFRREGILRRYLPFRGTTVDAVMYAMVRDESVDADGDGIPDDPLARVSLFAGLAPAELARIRAVTTETALAAGATLMVEGDPGDAMYVVLDGTLAITTRSGSGEVPVTTVGPGTVQGEIAVLEGGVRRATVRSVTPARLLRIGRDDLFDVMAREPAIIRSLAATVAGRLLSWRRLQSENAWHR
jgi:RimJ/RimL family protein N-acetyltransferase